MNIAIVGVDYVSFVLGTYYAELGTNVKRVDIDKRNESLKMKLFLSMSL